MTRNQQVQVSREMMTPLFRHYLNSTAALLTTSPASEIALHNPRPDLAPRYPYLRHETLAVAALHLSYLVPQHGKEYLRIATEHQSKALRLFRAALQDQTPEMAVPMFVCSAMFTTFYFCTPVGPCLVAL